MTIAERIAGIKVEVECAREWLDDCIAEYEDALEHPGYYDVDLAREQMTEAQGDYDYLLERLEALTECAIA